MKVEHCFMADDKILAMIKLVKLSDEGGGLHIEFL